MKKIDQPLISKWNSLEEDKKEDYKANIVNNLLEEDKEEESKEGKSQEIKKVSKKKKKPTNFCICTAKCRGEKELIQHVIAKNGWKETIKYFDGNLIWFGVPLKETDINDLKKSKIIFNRYPEADIFSHKKDLGIILNRMAKYFHQEFDFYPKTYIIPQDLYILKEDMKSKNKFTYIFKPSGGSQGEGILLFNRFEEIENAIKFANGKEVIVQRYIDEPLLVEKKKFDLRIYVLIMGLNPIVGYVCNEGLARFCTENYDKPTKENLNKFYMHLTNYSLNKNSENYIVCDNYLEENDASKRTLTSLYKSLSKIGINYEEFIEEFNDIVYKTLIATEPFLTNKFHAVISKSQIDLHRCFQVFGFDILFDCNKKPWLLEINSNPSLNIFLEKQMANGEETKELSEIDKYVKTIVVEDSINIVKKNLKHNKLVEKYKSFVKVIPSPNENQDYKFKVFNRAIQVFEALAGIKGCESISSGQFCKIGRIKDLNENILKVADYDIIYSSITGKKSTKLMTNDLFLDGLEIICNKLYGSSNDISKLNDLVDFLHNSFIKEA